MIPRALLTPRWILAFGISLAAAAILPNILGGWYLDSDDWLLIRMGREVAAAPTLEHFAGFWTEDPVWRPLLTLRVGLEYAAFGDAYDPRIIVNLLLHVACALMVFLLARAWLGRSTPAAWTAVFWFVHPLHAEALAWAHSGTEAITVTLPILVALWAFASHRGLVLGLVAFQLALFLGEAAVCVPLVISVAAYARSSRGQRFRRMVAESYPYWVMLLLNIGIRLVALDMDSGQTGSGSLHVTHDPLAVFVSTAFLPWIPTHPALPGRVAWWFIFAAVPFGLAVTQRLMDTTPLKTAFIAYGILCLPFMLRFHDAGLFLTADDTAWHRGWYHFYLPLAPLMLWPAYVISTRDRRRTGWSTVALVALFGLLLTAQTLNARWWRAQGQTAHEILDQVDDAISQDAKGVGLAITAGADAGLAGQVFLNVPIIRPQDGAPIQAYRLLNRGEETVRLERSVADARGQVHWQRVDSLPTGVRWWVWNAAAARLEPLEPKSLPTTVASADHGI